MPPGDLARDVADGGVRGACAHGDDHGRAVAGPDQHVRGPGRAVEEVPLPQASLLALHDEEALPGHDEEGLVVRLRVVEATRAPRVEHGEVEGQGRPSLLRLEPRSAPQAVLADPPDVPRVDDVPAAGLRGETVARLDGRRLLDHDDHLP